MRLLSSIVASACIGLAFGCGSGGGSSPGTPPGGETPGDPSTPNDEGVRESEIDLGEDEFPSTAMVRPDGRIVVVGVSAASERAFGQGAGTVFVLGATAEGTRDPSFGDDGVRRLDLKAQRPVAALAPDGSVLVAGFSAVVRVRPDGSVDPAFGGGAVTIQGGANAIAVAADGKVLVSTTTGVLRLDADGKADGQHGTDGVATLDDTSYLRAIVPSADGGYVVCSDGDAFVLARLDASGKLDPSFGDGGKIAPHAKDDVVTATTMNDGFVVTAATNGSTFVKPAAYRYDERGATVTTFGNGGAITADEAGLFADPRSTKDGRLFLRAQRAFGSVELRILPDGTRDTTFGNGGVLALDTVDLTGTSRRHLTALSLLSPDEHTVIVVGRAEDPGSASRPDGSLRRDVWIARHVVP